MAKSKKYFLRTIKNKKTGYIFQENIRRKNKRAVARTALEDKDNKGTFITQRLSASFGSARRATAATSFLVFLHLPFLFFVLLPPAQARAA